MSEKFNAYAHNPAALGIFCIFGVAIGGIIIDGGRKGIELTILGASILGLSLGVLVGFSLNKRHSLPLAHEKGCSGNQNCGNQTQWDRRLSRKKDWLRQKPVQPIYDSLLKLISRSPLNIVHVEIMRRIRPIHAIAKRHYTAEDNCQQSDDVTLSQSVFFPTMQCGCAQSICTSPERFAQLKILSKWGI
jgi:hypothetical protein